MSGALFTCDLEDYYHALTPYATWWKYHSRLEEPTQFLLSSLRTEGITGIFYVLGHVAEFYPALIKAIATDGHQIGSHGYYHEHGETEGDSSDRLARKVLADLSPWGTKPTLYRSPYWDSTQRPGYSGGAFFRLLPFPLLKVELRRTKQFWIHPHDLDPGQPRLPHAPWWRYCGLKEARRKLQRLLHEHSWQPPQH